ncbi:MAG: sigma-70 family RNA polymerase sigma factor [Bacteroidota bacterium]
MTQMTDLELVEHFRTSGRNRYLGEIFERYAHLVFGLCLKYLESQADSRDAVSQIFEKLIKDLRKHEVKHFRSWLYMVARNHCLMILRERQSGRKRQQRYQEFQPSEAEVAALDGEQGRLEANLTELEAALQDLKAEQRTCLDLFYLQEKCYREVADITGYTLKQVKSYIQNGKRNLRNNLTQRI